MLNLLVYTNKILLITLNFCIIWFILNTLTITKQDIICLSLWYYQNKTYNYTWNNIWNLIKLQNYITKSRAFIRQKYTALNCTSFYKIISFQFFNMYGRRGVSLWFSDVVLIIFFTLIFMQHNFFNYSKFINTSLFKAKIFCFWNS